MYPDIETLGEATVALFDAGKNDGIGFDDVDEGMSFISAVRNSIDELKGDSDAAILDLASYLTAIAADRRRNSG